MPGQQQNSDTRISEFDRAHLGLAEAIGAFKALSGIFRLKNGIQRVARVWRDYLEFQKSMQEKFAQVGLVPKDNRIIAVCLLKKELTPRLLERVSVFTSANNMMLTAIMNDIQVCPTRVSET